MSPKYYYTTRYAVYGAIFGMLFPIGATLFDIGMSSLEFSWINIVKVQTHQPLHWIIDTAPFFLGLFASFAGRRQDRLKSTNIDLEKEIEVRLKQINHNNEKLKEEIRERKEIESKLNEALVLAKQGEKAKEDFLINMSHEIRTPMNSVIGIANLLNEQDPTPDQKESLEVLLFSANNLLRIINDILDISKIEAGAVDIVLDKVDLRDTVRKVVDEQAFRIKEQKILYSTKIDSKVPQRIITDEVKLIQILENLLSNAIKFSPKGKVDIVITVDSEDEEFTHLLFSINDTGIGISKENSENIYEIFQQEDTGKSSNHSGTGLGLSIVRNLLHLLGSEIHHKERKEHGTEFYFYLSCKKINEPVKKPLPTPAEVSLLQGKNILLVEDNLMNQKVTMKFLSKWNIDCDLAQNGIEAVQLDSSKEYQLILMDLQMPEMDGYDATIEIRKFNQAIPIIALTATALVDVREKSMEVGMNDFITKPYQPAFLLEKLIHHLSE